MKLGLSFQRDELKQLRIKSKGTSSIPVLFKISKEFLEFCGLWIGDGCYDRRNNNVVIISNVDEECREVFRKVASYANAGYSEMDTLVGGTGVLIIVSVIVETVRQLQAQMIMRSYDEY